MASPPAATTRIPYPPGAANTNLAILSHVDTSSSPSPSTNYLTADYNPVGSFTSNGTGWQELSEAFREVDRKKMKDHVKDIDTALVFTGLFSAVLTAFLLESVNDLRPPSQDITVRLMYQIALQTRSYSNGSGYYLNTTDTQSPPFRPDSFHPPVNAVAVNVVWFAGLTLSLITASLAILAKQWLRENFTGDRTSPQAFFRIRYFRYNAFEDWHVFDIVAIVYLLQQVYLALFLVGLCLYTGGVHNAISRTTSVLVAGWGLLIVVAILAPIFSPRCPYRTSLLIHGMKSLRALLARALHSQSAASETRSGQAQDGSKSWRQPYSRYLQFDDEKAAQDANEDIDILLSLDSLQKDQHLLKPLWDALQPSLDTHDRESAKCIMKIFGNHAQDPSAPFFDLKHLPYAVIEPAMIMLAKISVEILNEIDRRPPANALQEMRP